MSSLSNIDKVKIVVIGDAGVGKTSLVHLICHNLPINKPEWTIGCSIEVKLHDYKAGTSQEVPYFVELWDVGGWTAHTNSRAVFYNSVNGIILVHDLTNRKSHQNLRKWLAEVLNKDNLGSIEELDYDAEVLAGSDCPIIVVGTRSDMAIDKTQNENLRNRTFNIAEECGADEINLDCTHDKHLAPGTTNAVKLSRFFDKVIEKRYFRGDLNQFNDRRRLFIETSHWD